LFEQLEMVAFNPNERTHARTSRSDEALDDEYGDDDSDGEHERLTGMSDQLYILIERA
jgi:hypothetical protein